MALGRSSVPNQTNPGPASRATSQVGDPFSKTSVPEQHADLRRDYEGDRRKAIEEMIAAYEVEGKDTSHLKRTLGGKKGVTGWPVGGVVPQPMEPGTSGNADDLVVVSADGVSVAEPEDLSAPDKREQDQRPKGDGFSGPVDPGPEYGRKKADRLPDQVNADPATAPASTQQEPRRDSSVPGGAGVADNEEEKAAAAAVSPSAAKEPPYGVAEKKAAPAKKAPAKKAPAKRAAPRKR